MDLMTLGFIVAAVVAAIFLVMWLTKKSKVQTVDKMKVVSNELLKSNEFNGQNGTKWVVSGGKTIFNVLGKSFYRRNGEDIYLMNVLPVISVWGGKIIFPKFWLGKCTFLVNKGNFRIEKDKLILRDNFTLTRFYNIIYNFGDTSAHEYLDEFSQLLNKHIVDSALYAQAQRDTVVTIGTVAKGKGETENVQIDTEKINKITQ